MGEKGKKKFSRTIFSHDSNYGVMSLFKRVVMKQKQKYVTIVQKWYALKIGSHHHYSRIFILMANNLVTGTTRRHLKTESFRLR